LKAKAGKIELYTHDSLSASVAKLRKYPVSKMAPLFVVQKLPNTR